MSGSEGVRIFCVNCVSRANFSVGIELDVMVVPFAINSAHINITVEQFEQFIQLETSLTGNISFQKSVDFIKIPLPDLGFEVFFCASLHFIPTEW